jgi:hypothetical protein
MSHENRRINRKMGADNVNHPSHYTDGKIEVIDYIEDKLTTEGFESYCIGNVIKYISRYRLKNGLEDLKKAAWYLDRAIKHKEETTSEQSATVAIKSSE